MYAKNKPVIALTAEERRYRNLLTAGMFSSTVQNIGDILEEINKIDS